MHNEWPETELTLALSRSDLLCSVWLSQLSPVFWGSVPRQVLRARQYSHINIHRPNSQPILGNSVPFPFTCHASLGTQVMSVHLLASVMVDYFPATQSRANTTTHIQTACGFLRIISLWSVSAWVDKAHFLPSVHSLYMTTENAPNQTDTHSRSTCINSRRR